MPGESLRQPEPDSRELRAEGPQQVERQRQLVEGKSLARLELAQAEGRPGLTLAQLVVPARLEPGQPGLIEPVRPDQRARVARVSGNRAYPAAACIAADRDKASPVVERDTPAAGANLAGEHNREDRHIPAEEYTLAATASPEPLPEA